VDIVLKNGQEVVVMANILIVVITGVEEVGRSSSSIAGTATC
jgi:hypothetical protein